MHLDGRSSGTDSSRVCHRGGVSLAWTPEAGLGFGALSWTRRTNTKNTNLSAKSPIKGAGAGDGARDVPSRPGGASGPGRVR